MKSYLYILYSNKLDRYYIGSTNNLERRMNEHATQHTNTTKNNTYYLVFNQEFDTLNAARKAEMKLKKWKRRDILETIIREGKMRSI